jgi:hypothetical protein
MEQPEIYEITLNGKRIIYRDEGWWRDRSFKRIDIRDTAVEGRNELEVAGTFITPQKPGKIDFEENGIEVENAYIVGNFSVRLKKGVRYTLLPPFADVKCGNLVHQGFPFFSGSLVLAQDVPVRLSPGEKVFLEFDGLEAITTRVFVNGADAGIIAFHPYRIEITPFVRDGNNHIQVELTNSVRNLLGPHHNILEEPMDVSPGDFYQTVFKRYGLVPFGITSGARLAYYR